MSQKIADQEEEQANWYGAIAAIAANLDCECKTEPPSSEPSEEDPALEEDQDQSENEDVKEEAIEYQDAKKEPTELSHAKKETKAEVPEPALPPSHATPPPWRTAAWQNYWSHDPATGASSSYSRPGPYHAEASCPAAAPAYGPSRQPASSRDQYMTGWKAKVCYFLSAWNHQGYTRCGATSCWQSS